jgi:C-terminal peptidase (prc)
MKSKMLFAMSFAMSLVFVSQNAVAQSPAQLNTQKFAATLYYIENFYVDSAAIEHVTESAIVEALKELDPHSAYISKKDVEKANEPLVGSFDGIGVSYQLVRDTITVISPIPGGPSDKVGIMAGDKIMKIDGENAFGKKIDNEYVQEHLRGKKGTKVSVSILRGDDDEMMDFVIVRDKIPLNSINASFMITNKIGYIKLDRFARKSSDEFEKAVAKLRDQGMKSLILDLRGNTGGYLDIAINMVDQFLGRNKLIVYTEGRKSERAEWKSTDAGVCEKDKLVVLIDEGSASASEILSGAIQDHDRGVIIGRRSFGKGLVQRPFNLPDGSIIRLTTSRYHTPTGRCIQRSYEEGTEDYEKDLLKRLEHGEYFHADSIQFPDSLKYKTSNGRTVYGGGGIMPDVFIPIDTAFNSKLYTNLVRKGVFNRFTVDYSMENRDKIKANYKDFDAFQKDFVVTDEMILNFKKDAEKEKIEWIEDQYKRSEKFIKLQIKALIARNIYDMEQYYQVIMSEDKGLLKAIEILGDDKGYKKILQPK